MTAIYRIGKEANHWEEQFHLGLDPDAQVNYGPDPQAEASVLCELRPAVETYGLCALARAAGVSRQYVSAIITGETNPTDVMPTKALRGVAVLDAESRTEDEWAQVATDAERLPILS